MTELFFKALVLALMVKFILILGYKWKIIDYLQVNTRGVLHRLLSCDFCMGFWLALGITAVFGGPLLIVPCAAVIVSL